MEKVVPTNLDKTLALLTQISTGYFPSVLSSALGPGSMVMLDLIVEHKLNIEVVTIDTGRLPKETYNLMQAVFSRFGPVLKVLYPDATEIGDWVQRNGVNGYYQSVELRKQCCNIRKVLPLKRFLVGKKAWLTGLRREQSPTRAAIEVRQWDSNYNLYKFNPMVDWTAQEVWAYIHSHSIPYNKLLDEGYKSVGCTPCSRAVRPSEDERAGRWWWERGSLKECGLHFDPKSGRLMRNDDH